MGGMDGKQLWESIKGKGRFDQRHLLEAFLDSIVPPSALFEAMAIGLQEEAAKHAGKVPLFANRADSDEWDEARYYPLYALSTIVPNALDKLRTCEIVLKDSEE